MDLRAVLEVLCRELERAGVAHALIGGLALAAHGVGRPTEDVDLLIDGDRADDLDAIMRALGYRPLHRTQDVANYAADDPVKGRVDCLYAHRPRARAMLERAEARLVLGAVQLPVADASDLIGLKVQSSSNDARRRRTDVADIVRLLRSESEIDLERLRDYFKLFDREAELDELLAEIGQR